MDNAQTKTNTFTDEGRLLQAEYAIKNVSKAGTIAGIACSDGVVLLGINPSPSETLEKIYKLNDEVFCAVAGVFGDALRIIKFARFTSLSISEKICQLPDISVLCDAISGKKQLYTLKGGSRPFGVSLLYSSFENDEYVLYSTDPSGTVNRWKAWAFGKNSDGITNGLRNELPEQEMDVEDGLIYLLRMIDKAKEMAPELADSMEVLIFKRDEQKIMEKDKIKEIIERLIEERRETD